MKSNPNTRNISAIRKELDAVLTGGNHLATVLIGRLGAEDSKFPPYRTPVADVQRLFVEGLLGVEDYDIWIAWRAIMLLRDRLDEEDQPVAS